MGDCCGKRGRQRPRRSSGRRIEQEDGGGRGPEAQVCDDDLELGLEVESVALIQVTDSPYMRKSASGALMNHNNHEAVQIFNQSVKLIQASAGLTNGEGSMEDQIKEAYMVVKEKKQYTIHCPSIFNRLHALYGTVDHKTWHGSFVKTDRDASFVDLDRRLRVRVMESSQHRVFMTDGFTKYKAYMEENQQTSVLEKLVGCVTVANIGLLGSNLVSTSALLSLCTEKKDSSYLVIDGIHTIVSTPQKTGGEDGTVVGTRERFAIDEKTMDAILSDVRFLQRTDFIGYYVKLYLGEQADDHTVLAAEIVNPFDRYEMSQKISQQAKKLAQAVIGRKNKSEVHEMDAVSYANRVRNELTRLRRV